MSQMNSTGDRLRRANQLWHAYLSATGQRFELAQFLKDPVFEKATLDSALGSGDAKLIGLVNDWLRDTGQALPAVAAQRGIAAIPAAAAEATKPARYLRGVR